MDAPRIAIGWVIGALLASWLPQVPSHPMLCGIAVAAILPLFWRRTRVPMVSALLLGAVWFAWQADGALRARWPSARDGDDVIATVRVTDLPRTQERVQRFDARVLTAEGLPRGARLRLSWYAPAPTLQPGDRIEATLRLRRPRGQVNPGGFDGERHALAERIVAVGYVRAGRLLADDGGGTIDRWRAHIAARIDTAVSDSHMAALLKALAVGDVRGLNDADWDVLRATGTGHLVAISGLHVGLVAIFGAWWMRLLYAVRPRLGLRWPRPQAEAAMALVFAIGYAALAGFGVAVLRTLAMMAVALSGVMLRRRFGGFPALAVAAALIVAGDPLSVLAAGFWLSVLGVGFLIWAMAGSETHWRGLWRTQVAMSIGLLPIGAWWFAQTSVVGLLTNLVAVPWITFVVVPVLLAGMILDLTVGVSAGYAVAATILQPLWHGLAAVSATSFASWHFADVRPWSVLLAIVGVAWALLPRGVPLRAFGVVMLLPLIWPKLPQRTPGEFSLIVLDVGQGLSAVIRTHTHTLVFDTGPRWSDDADAGDAVVVPSLRAMGVATLDLLVTSHLDADHAGGRDAVRRAFPNVREQVGPEADPAPRCEAGQSWQWDGVQFSFLHPTPYFPDLDNDTSCVLRVASPQGSVLLSGDLGTVMEERLAREHADALDVDVVVAGHHGSKTSSSPAWVDATSAETVVIARGWRNRFGHPAAAVAARWRAAGAQLRDTALDGAVIIDFDRDGRHVRSLRVERTALWRESGHD